MSGPLPAVPKAVRVDFHFSEGLDPNMQVRNFFQYSGTLNTADAVTWAHQCATAMASFVSSEISSDITLIRTELTDLTSNTSPQVVDNTTQVGGVVAQTVPAGTAMVISRQIARRYRGGHPRVYLPGMPATYLATVSKWDSTSQASVVAHWGTFITACKATGSIPSVGTINDVNISYFHGFTNFTYPSGRTKAIPTPRATPLVDTIVAYVGNPVVASQRRRNEQP